MTDRSDSLSEDSATTTNFQNLDVRLILASTGETTQDVGKKWWHYVKTPTKSSRVDSEQDTESLSQLSLTSAGLSQAQSIGM